MMSTARLWYTPLAPLLLAAVLLAGVFVFAATRTRKPAAFGSDDLYCLSALRLAPGPYLPASSSSTRNSRSRSDFVAESLLMAYLTLSSERA